METLAQVGQKVEHDQIQANSSQVGNNLIFLLCMFHGDMLTCVFACHNDNQLQPG